jgi:hypothetical protein
MARRGRHPVALVIISVALRLGLLGHAYAGSATAPFTINVEPPMHTATLPLTISVQPPSSGPSVPSEAATAGFTTLAANYDFSQPLYATQSNWLDCSGTDINPAHQWHAGIWWSTPPGQGGIPCNIHQVTDPIYGNTVMNFKWLSSYDSYGNTGAANFVQMETINKNANYHTDFPVGLYIEAVYRTTLIDSRSNSSGPNSIYTWTTAAAHSSGFGPIEMDVTELYGGRGGYSNAGVGNHGNGLGGFTYTSYGTNKLPSGYAVTRFHKYGMLETTDGTSQIWGCSYVDDILQSCRPMGTPGTPPNSFDFTNRNFLIVGGGASNTPSKSNDTYFQYIRVWTCSNPTNGMTCSGPVVTGRPRGR